MPECKLAAHFNALFSKLETSFSKLSQKLF